MSDSKKVYLLKETAEFNFVNEVDEKGSPKTSKYGNMLVKGVLQRADTINQNGRIYPKDILYKEVENYKKLVSERRALGECVDELTEILTYDGWKFIKDISEKENVYTLNLLSEEIQLQQIERKVQMDFDGEMFRFTNNKKIDMQLTPNHKMVLWDENNKPCTLFAKELYKQMQARNNKFINFHVKTGRTINENKCKQNHSFVSSFNVKKLKYNGKVYCVTVPNGTWLMRRNGKISWTGNCDHAEEAVVNLKNVSHVITDIWWDGDVVHGQVEILEAMDQGRQLKALFQNGIKVGISSRAIGSVRTINGVNYVQDDLQLVCWDFVSEPSTPGAFMFSEARELSRKELEKIYQAQNKTDRLNRIVNDILGIKKL